MKSTEYSKNKRRDSIVISLIDESNITYFKGKAHISDKKGMSRLLTDLHLKGVNLAKSIDWFE